MKLGVNSESHPKLHGPPSICDGIAAQALSPQINTPAGNDNGTLVERDMLVEV